MRDPVYQKHRVGDSWEVVLHYPDDEFTPDEWVATCHSEALADRIINTPTPSNLSCDSEYVHVLQITMDGGTDVWVYRNHADAFAHVVAFAKNYWSCKMGADEEMPDDDDEIVEAYFEQVEGREEFDISREPVKEGFEE